MTTTAPRRRQTVNLRRRIIVAALLVLLIGASLSIVLWGPDSTGSGDLSGSVLLWHSLSGSGADTLDTVLADFEDLHPQTTVYRQPFDSQDELLAQYEEAVRSGLGPDLVLGDAMWIPALAAEGSIRPIEGQVPPETLGDYLPAAIASVTFEEKLYGLPMSLHVPALYYNTRLVESPPETLDALLTQAAEGNTVLMSTDFRDALWGVQAFGGRFFDEKGRAILDQGGYANWLDWITTARTAPGMILDTNRQSLQERFLQGDDAYYIGYPEEISTLTEGIGEENLGVAPLPSGPTGSAAPFLGVDTLLFSPVSSGNQREIALELAEFITNMEQSSAFMRNAQLVPANTRVRINPRLHPLLAGFLAQAGSALALPSLVTRDAMWNAAVSAYNRAMSGLSTPLEAALETTASLNSLNGIDDQPSADNLCTNLGTVRLVHDWEGADAEVLDEIIQRFKQVCPLVIVKAEYADLADVLSNWDENPSAATNPDVVLGSQEWLVDALEAEIPLKDVGQIVAAETLQRYLPASVTGMRGALQLHGLPMSFRVDLLYYNKELVDDPAPILDRMRLQADDGVPITLEAQFSPAYWGVGAFGGRLLDPQGRPALDEGGFANWLTWLRQSRDEHSMRLVYSHEDAKNAFLNGESAYFVGRPLDRLGLMEALGDNLGVALLPAGPQGAATPLFLTTGLIFGNDMSQNDLDAALSFALFATNAENQQLLAEKTERIPANATVDLTDEPYTDTVLEQARTAIPVQNQMQMYAIRDLGDETYIDVLLNGADPQAAAEALTQEMYALYGIEPDPTAAPTTTTTAGVTTTTEAPAPAGTSTAPDDTGSGNASETDTLRPTDAPTTDNEPAVIPNATQSSDTDAVSPTPVQEQP